MGSNQALKDQNDLLRQQIETLRQNSNQQQQQNERLQKIIQDNEAKRQSDMSQFQRTYEEMKESHKKENDALLLKLKTNRIQFKYMLKQTESIIKIILTKIYEPELIKELNKLLENQDKMLKEDEQDLF